MFSKKIYKHWSYESQQTNKQTQRKQQTKSPNHNKKTRPIVKAQKGLREATVLHWNLSG